MLLNARKSLGSVSMDNERFFDSDIVMAAIEDISDMQNQVLLFSQYADFASVQDQKENLVLLKELHAKQKNMCFRCILSTDTDAKLLLEDVIQHFEGYGHKVDRNNPMEVFEEVYLDLLEIEKGIIFAEEHGYYPDEESGGETPRGL